MTTAAQLRVLAGATPGLRNALENITAQAHTVATTPGDAVISQPAPGAGWQEQWIQEHNTPTSAPLAGRILLHPVVPAVRLDQQEGEWVLPGLGMAGEQADRRVVLGERQYSVEVGDGGVVPENVRERSSAWIVAGDRDPWGFPVGPEAAAVLDSLHQSAKVPGWQAEWLSVEQAQLAAVLAFGPYLDRVASYEAAVADAAPDDELVSLAVDMVDADVVVLGFGTNLPSTRRPMTLAGRTS